LKLAPFSKEPVSHDGLDFKFFFSVDHFGRWAVEVGPVFFCFVIRCEE
jgi:hypothetical protein